MNFAEQVDQLYAKLSAIWEHMSWEALTIISIAVWFCVSSFGFFVGIGHRIGEVLANRLRERLGLTSHDDEDDDESEDEDEDVASVTHEIEEEEEDAEPLKGVNLRLNFVDKTGERQTEFENILAGELVKIGAVVDLDPPKESLGSARAWVLLGGTVVESTKPTGFTLEFTSDFLIWAKSEYVDAFEGDELDYDLLAKYYDNKNDENMALRDLQNEFLSVHSENQVYEKVAKPLTHEVNVNYACTLQPLAKQYGGGMVQNSDLSREDCLTTAIVDLVIKATDGIVTCHDQVVKINI